MSPKSISGLSLNQKLTLLMAFIAAVAVVVAAFIAGHDWFTANHSSSEGTSLIPSLTPSPFSKNVDFVTTDMPGILTPNLQWDAGSSDKSTYTFEGDTLTMTAGPGTWPNFPMVSYNQPLTGNFNIQVKLFFIPEKPVLITAQMAGLLVRPVNARMVQDDKIFPPDWVATARTVTDAGNLVGCRGSWDGYSLDTVYLMLEREGNSWRCAYSSNGKNWIWLSVGVDETELQGKPLVASLFVYSDTDKALTVKFSDWVISGNQRK